MQLALNNKQLQLRWVVISSCGIWTNLGLEPLHIEYFVTIFYPTRISVPMGACWVLFFLLTELFVQYIRDGLRPLLAYAFLELQTETLGHCTCSTQANLTPRLATKLVVRHPRAVWVPQLRELHRCRQQHRHPRNIAFHSPFHIALCLRHLLSLPRQLH